MAAPAAYGSSLTKGLIGAAAAGLHHSRGNTGSLTHCVKPGIKPTSSWTLCWVLNLLNHNGNFYLPFFFFFLWMQLWHMEVPRLGVKSELQLLPYATATAMPDLSRICDLHSTAHGKAGSFNPRSEARD